MRLFCDGSCIPNPGKMKLGFAVLDGEKEIIKQTVYLGYGTSNQAEYLSLINALNNCLNAGINSIDVFMDSMVVVQQIKGNWKVKDKVLKELYIDAMRLRGRFHRFSINHIPREENYLADKLSRRI